MNDRELDDILKKALYTTERNQRRGNSGSKQEEGGKNYEKKTCKEILGFRGCGCYAGSHLHSPTDIFCGADKRYVSWNMGRTKCADGLREERCVYGSG